MSQILLAAVFGALATLVSFRSFGTGDQVEHLPIILRAMDPGYLPNDFFTNAVSDTVARAYYARLIGWIAGTPNRLPMSMAALCLLSNITSSIITCLLGHTLHRGRRGAGVCASALAMSVSTFSLGWAAHIYLPMLIPSSIAIALVMAAALLALRGHLLASMLACGLAALVHPLFGLEVGALLVFAYLFARLADRDRRGSLAWRHIAGSVLTFGVFASILVVPQATQTSLDADTFVYIVAFFRHPHHYVPSSFGKMDYFYAIGFLTAATLIFCRGWGRRDKRDSIFVAAICLAVFALCLGGYLFVEIWPSRLWVTAQTYRLLYVVKWLGLIVIGGALADLRSKPVTQALAWVATLHPITLGAAVVAREAVELLKERFGHWISAAALALWCVLCVAVWLVLSVSRTVALLVLVYMLLIRVVEHLHSRWLTAGLLSLVTIALAVRFFVIAVPQPLPAHAWPEHELDPGYVSSRLGPGGREAAIYARENTPEDAIFLTPPKWGQFRLLARRAIVIDFKSFIFSDAGIREWYDRHVQCYGQPTRESASARQEFERNYSAISDAELVRLGQLYGVDYAVLYAKTASGLPVVYKNDHYRIVEVTQTVGD